MITDIDRMYSASSILFTFMQSFTPIGLYCWTRSLVVKWSHHGIEMAESNIVLAIVRFSYASFQSMISFRFVVKTRLSQCQCQYQCQVIGNYRTVPRSPYLLDASLSIFPIIVKSFIVYVITWCRKGLFKLLHTACTYVFLLDLRDHGRCLLCCPRAR